MKHKLLYMVISGVVLLTATSCSTISRTGITANVPAPVVYPNEIVADLDFNTDDKIEGTVKCTYILSLKVSGGNSYAEIAGMTDNKSFVGMLFGTKGRHIRSMAIAKALENTDYDIIANPQYTTVCKRRLLGLVTEYTVTVKGYGAKIKNFTHVESKSSDNHIFVPNDIDVSVRVDKKSLSKLF